MIDVLVLNRGRNHRARALELDTRPLRAFIEKLSQYKPVQGISAADTRSGLKHSRLEHASMMT